MINFMRIPINLAEDKSWLFYTILVHFFGKFHTKGGSDCLCCVVNMHFLAEQ